MTLSFLTHLFLHLLVCYDFIFFLHFYYYFLFIHLILLKKQNKNKTKTNEEKQTDESEQTQEKQEKEIAISSVFSSSWGALCCRLAEKPDEIEKVLCDLLEKREEREKEGGEGGGEEEGRGTGRGFDYFIFSLLGNVFEMGGWSVAKKTGFISFLFLFFLSCFIFEIIDFFIFPLPSFLQQKEIWSELFLMKL